MVTAALPVGTGCPIYENKSVLIMIDYTFLATYTYRSQSCGYISATTDTAWILRSLLSCQAAEE
jgi:hypothetical protein